MIFIASHCIFIVASHCYCSSCDNHVLENYPTVQLMLFITLNLLLGDMGYGSHHNLTEANSKFNKGVDWIFTVCIILVLDHCGEEIGLVD